MLTKNVNDVYTADEQDWVTIFNHLFGRDPTAQEKAGRVRDDTHGQREMRTYNQSFVEAVAICHLIGDRSEPFNFDVCSIQDQGSELA